ncbi:GT2 family glycosyltransferase [Marmoricola sp. OAE513]|uniref:glycosyltransferase family 2 protein n=1 Tax=Marmoricola sp. OAE513 TaxID=2817894 RepID=UPI001DCA70F7
MPPASASGPVTPGARPETHPETRVVAVVVTWNRRDLLVESIEALRAQTHLPAAIVVVDNDSTDDTAGLLGSSFGDGLDVVRLQENTGGAGGFTVGVEKALNHHPDLVWLLDDDTVPTPTAAAELVAAWENYPGERPAVLASRVVWTDGRDHPMNTPRAKPGATAEEKAAAATVGAFPVRSASFVSIMCDAATIRERGLPVADYFLWNDDFEYSTRLIRDGVGLSCPSSLVVHKTKVFGSTDVDPGERFYFEVRNKLWVFSRSGGLSLPERGLYSAATARRWVRTFRSSSDRKTLRRALGRGLIAGLRRPRTNGAVLATARPVPVPAAEPLPFSLLISTYGGDDPAYLRDAFVSSTERQTRAPAEVVLVQDGPVPPALAAEIARIVETSPIPVKHLELAENLGLGPALDAGLAASSHEVVARMDSDDVSRPDRFARQLPLIEAGADIVGSGLIEFGSSIEDVVGTRTPPTDPDEIRRVIRFRDPFNHPTVVYRRSAVLAAGGYTDMALLEDYLLFTRMVEGGAVPANLAEPLVYYRVGDGAYARRGGTSLLRSEIALQRRFRRLGITSRTEFVRNVAVRGGYRLVPEGVRKVAYRRLLANRTGEARG